MSKLALGGSRFFGTAVSSHKNIQLADRYSVSRIEKACTRALYYTSTPNLRNIRTILKTSQDKVTLEEPANPSAASGKFGFIRGREYYLVFDLNYIFQLDSENVFHKYNSIF